MSDRLRPLFDEILDPTDANEAPVLAEGFDKLFLAVEDIMGCSWPVLPETPAWKALSVAYNEAMKTLHIHERRR